MNKELSRLAVFVLLWDACSSFSTIASRRSRSPLYASPGEDNRKETVSRQFTMLVCAASACARKRQTLGLDEYATLAALCDRGVAVEETRSCLGGCQLGPCVSVEHEDFEGPVALEGMRPQEFRDRVFHGVATDDDADRVWSCVERGVEFMVHEELQQQDS